MSEMYAARRSMTYGRNGEEKQLDRGQILQLTGEVNDEKLVRLAYVELVSKGVTIVECGKCGARFKTDETLASHGRERHRNLKLTPKEEDERTDKRHKFEDAIAPLDMTKTKASLGESTSNVVTTQKRTPKKRSNRAAV